MQKELLYPVGNFSGSTYILTDKNGNSIWDIPNTTGMTISYFQYSYFVLEDCSLQ